MNQSEAIILVFTKQGGARTIKEIRDWIDLNYPNTWKDPGTAMADLFLMEGTCVSLITNCL